MKLRAPQITSYTRKKMKKWLKIFRNRYIRRNCPIDESPDYNHFHGWDD
jgi:hypothetical protein